MTEDETTTAAQMSVYAVLYTANLWKYLEAQPGEEVAAEVVGQALDALMDLSNTLMDRVGVGQ